MNRRLVSNCQRRPIDQHKWRRHTAIEPLEDRLQLSVTISNVHLTNDTGASPTDSNTSDPTIAGSVSSANPFSVQVRDNNGVVGYATVSNGTFTYNPLANDSALQHWEGALDLQYRSVESIGYGGVATSAWTDFNITLDRVAPVSSGIDDTEVNENDPPTSIDLTPVFTDGATPTSSLTYAVVGNTNPSLFSSVGISGGVLTLTYATNQWGDANITVRATDLAGNTVDTTFDAIVDWIDVPPVISNFQMTNSVGNAWTISGTVTDDTDPTGYVVTFGGVLSSYNYYAIVNSNGSFSTTEIIDDLQSGIATAQTSDWQMLGSNVAAYFVA